MTLATEVRLSHLSVGPELAECDGLRDVFVRNVSHELRTPVGVVLGYAELLRDGALGKLRPEQRPAVLAIVNRANELRTIVERTSIMLGVQEGRFLSIPVALDVVVREVVESARENAAGAGLTLAYCCEAVPEISGDPIHLREAVICLVENAIKFTPAGGHVQVDVCGAPEEVCVIVNDTGIGIGEDQRDYILSGFSQVDVGMTRKYGGMGLGLALVGCVARAHGGIIGVRGNLSGGSSFTLTLPRVPDDMHDGAQRRVSDIRAFIQAFPRVPEVELPETGIAGMDMDESFGR